MTHDKRPRVNVIVQQEHGTQWRRAVVLRTIHVWSSLWQSEEPAKVHELSSSEMVREGEREGRGSRKGVTADVRIRTGGAEASRTSDS